MRRSFQIDEVVKNIRGFCETIEDSIIVDKVLRTLPKRFDPKVSSLEQRKDLDTITMDELHGILTAYEMRIDVDQSSKKEETFKESNMTRKDIHSSKFSSIDELDEEEANIVKKLEREISKRKGKLSFKCLNCGRIGHFVLKFPYAKYGCEEKRNN